MDESQPPFTQLASGSHVFAIGDLHGHYSALETLLVGLQETYPFCFDGTIKPHFIFMGDYIDRGTAGREVIATIQEMQAKNDRCIALMGNHELLALEGFGKAKELQENKTWEFYYKEQSNHGYNGGNSFILEFGKNSSDALKNYVQAMQADAPLGSWMRNLTLLYKLSFSDRKILFVHGDIPSSIRTRRDLLETKQAMERRRNTDSSVFGERRAQEIKYGDPLLLSQKSFLWNRRFEDLEEKAVGSFCKDLEVDLVVNGHTPQEGSFRVLGNRIFTIDVGMTPAYGANVPTALVLKKDGVYSFSNGEECFIQNYPEKITA